MRVRTKENRIQYNVNMDIICVVYTVYTLSTHKIDACKFVWYARERKRKKNKPETIHKSSEKHILLFSFLLLSKQQNFSRKFNASSIEFLFEKFI